MSVKKHTKQAQKMRHKYIEVVAKLDDSGKLYGLAEFPTLDDMETELPMFEHSLRESRLHGVDDEENVDMNNLLGHRPGFGPVRMAF